jgi:FdrA protein
VRRGYYQDSVALMRLSTRLAALEGVRQASAVMATEANQALLAEAGLLTDEAGGAAANDLLLALEAASEDALGAAVAAAERLLGERVEATPPEAARRPRTVATGLEALPGANLLMVSTPGQYAAAEALKALKAGLHVFLFSDNVPLEHEVLLKQVARERGLLVMGPDCGTAILGGVALGFANVVERGGVGIVGPSGTGIQQVTALLDRRGAGISHAIGTGSRDLSEAVGGSTTLQALEALAEDSETRVIVLVAKPSAPAVAQRVLDRAQEIDKPVVVTFLGLGPDDLDWTGVERARTLDEAARLAVAPAPGPMVAGPTHSMAVELRHAVERARRGLRRGQVYLRGLYSGGTLCAEALAILAQMGLVVRSNVAMPQASALEPVDRSREHVCLDLGADEFTVGRPHPMIDFRARLERLRQEASDPTVAAILLDVVLGHGAHPDPAGELAPAIQQARAEAVRAERELAVVGSVCGTARDPQGLVVQEARLREAGMLVLESNAQATLVAAALATGRGELSLPGAGA